MTENIRPTLPKADDAGVQTAGLVNILEQRMREQKKEGRPYASMLTEMLAFQPRDPHMAAVVAQALRNVLVS